MIRERLKAVAQRVFGPYRLNRIYTIDLTDFSFVPPEDVTLGRITNVDELVRCDDPAVRSRSWRAGANAFGYGVWQNGTLACMSWFWTHHRFRDTLIWGIGENEAIMVELLTTERFRGAGLAPTVIRYASAQLRNEGFNRLYTWVWHSNAPSIRAFEKAGWRYIAFVAEVHLFGSKQPLRFEWRKRGTSRGLGRAE